MAKKKTEEPPKKMGRPPLEEGSKTARFAFRVTPEWLSWLVNFANHKRKDKAVVAREAIERMAKAEGFDPPPKE